MTGISFNTIGGFMFYIVTTMEVVLFYQFAKKYGAFIRKWQEKEEVFLVDPYFIRGKRLKFRVRFVAFFMLFMFLGLL